MIVRLTVFFCIMVVGLLYPYPLFAQEQNIQASKVALFISQIRGDECCQNGSIDQLQKQIEGFESNGSAATFTIRYDALLDSKYQDILKNLALNQFELGAFLEITPNLARDSGVVYLGSKENWSQAQHAYTVGYSFNDRKKIIDTYMTTFNKVFGFYPKIVTAWLIDTPSVNYLHDFYGVSMVQITREQWGTDSYTLSGGPIHYPYFGSRNWIFVPNNENPIDSDDEMHKNDHKKSRLTMVLRQTISDPLYNYGDSTNSFTSQPNDYSIDGKNFDYFKKLVDQSFAQRGNGYNFVVLGLENSMEVEYQNEFTNQISYVTEIQDINTLTVSNFFETYSNYIFESKMRVLVAKDLVNKTNAQSIWITTNLYQARILFRNDELAVTDLRIYSNEYEDPYFDGIAKNHGYWIVPFVFDGSRFYDEFFKLKSINEFVSKLLLPEFKEKNKEQRPTKNDFSTDSEGLKFSIEPGSNVTVKKEKNKTEIYYTSKFGNSEFIRFYTNKFIASDENFSKKVIHSDQNQSMLQTDCSSDDTTNETSCNFSFNPVSNEKLKMLRETQYPVYFPEITNREINEKNTILYAHNKYAIQQKNPIRFVFIPKDNKKYVTQAKATLDVSVDPPVQNTVLHQQEGNGTTFFDIGTNQIGKYTVSFSVENFVKKETVYVAPNCKENKKYCLLHPIEAYWYLLSIFYTKLRNF